MERLTEYINDSPGINTRKLQFHCDVGGYIVGDIARRLAAYEDKGLEPEEVLGKEQADEIALSLILANEYKKLGAVEELFALVKARDEGRVVVLEDVTAHQANTIMGMCERLNAMKARHGDDQEPLITWQLYNALMKSFTRAVAETALSGGECT